MYVTDGSPQEILEKLFRVFDVNSDGNITDKEMKRLVANLYGLLHASNPNAGNKDVIATTAFREMDRDEDGLVSRAEFVSAVMGQEQFSKMLTMEIINSITGD
jgi:Ca2+-binding EF-hand superfamily protein